MKFSNKNFSFEIRLQYKLISWWPNKLDHVRFVRNCDCDSHGVLTNLNEQNSTTAGDMRVYSLIMIKCVKLHVEARRRHQNF